MEKRIEHIINLFLEGKANPFEKAELLSWLKNSEDNKKAFLSYYSAWDMSMRTEFRPSEALEKMHQHIRECHLEDRIEKSAKHHRPHYIYIASSIAASILLVVGLFFFYTKSQTYINIREVAAQMKGTVYKTNDIQLLLSKNRCITLKGKSVNIVYHDGKASIDNKMIDIKSSSFNKFIVPKGHKGILALEDGTKIWIKAGTSIIYPTHFKGKTREIYVDGEIYINVVHNENMPFIVKTRNLNVKDIGTKFDVIAYPEEYSSKVVLERGSVNVSSVADRKNATARILSPGQMYNLLGNKERIMNVDISKYISWVNDIYDCDDETLQQVATELGRLYGNHIVCANSISQLSCCGKLDLQKDLPSLLKDIAEVLSIHYYVKNGVYYLTKKNV